MDVALLVKFRAAHTYPLFARLGGVWGEVAGTRAGGIHRVGAYAQHERRRGAPVEWEAGDAKRSRAAGVAQRRGADRRGGRRTVVGRR